MRSAKIWKCVKQTKILTSARFCLNWNFVRDITNCMCSQVSRTYAFLVRVRLIKDCKSQRSSKPDIVFFSFYVGGRKLKPPAAAAAAVARSLGSSRSRALPIVSTCGRQRPAAGARMPRPLPQARHTSGRRGSFIIARRPRRWLATAWPWRLVGAALEAAGPRK